MQLGGIALGATALLYVGLPFAKVLKHHLLHEPCSFVSFFVGVLLLVSPFFACLVAILTATSAIGRGVRMDVWTEAQLQPLRDVVNSRWVKVVPMVSVGIFLLAGVWLLSVHQRSNQFPFGAWYVFWFPSQILNEVRGSLAIPAVTSGVSWRNALPIRSEHWGEGRSMS